MGAPCLRPSTIGITHCPAERNRAVQSAFNASQSAEQSAQDAYTTAESNAWNTYTTGLDSLNAAAQANDDAIEAQYVSAVDSALQTWHGTESTAWGTYTTAMGALQNAPPLGARADQRSET